MGGHAAGSPAEGGASPPAPQAAGEEAIAIGSAETFDQFSGMIVGNLPENLTFEMGSTSSPRSDDGCSGGSTVDGQAGKAALQGEGTRRRCLVFPVSIFFIVTNEFCERFCFYGMKTILPIYLTQWLAFSQNTSTTLIHSFNFGAYFSALLGGILSDNLLGKFRTILYLSIVYAVGSIIMSVSAVPGVMPGDPPHWGGAAVGLLLIALGTGGIKPCVASFGGDQFGPHQLTELSIFFALFYFSINAGSVLSMFLTPLLRTKVHCFGQQSCYPLAFGVPAILMAVSIVIFVAGSRLYKREAARNNVVVTFITVVATASTIRAKRALVALSKGRRHDGAASQEESDDEQARLLVLSGKAHAGGPAGTADEASSAACGQEGGAAAGKSHWLYYVADRYDRCMIEDVRQVLSLLVLFLPITIFWALFEQQGSWWVYQAFLMDNKVSLFGGKWVFSIIPEQMGLANAFLILVLIPLFSHVIYPACERLGLPMRPAFRIGTGMVLSTLSFVITALLQYTIMSRGTFASVPLGRSGGGGALLEVAGTDAAEENLACIEGCVNILWQLPQYLVITTAEVLVAITGLEFAYSQAPTSMKSVCSAAWLLTVAGGDLIVIIVTLIDPVSWLSSASNQMTLNFFLWSILMALATVAFVRLSTAYTYKVGRQEQ